MADFERHLRRELATQAEKAPELGGEAWSKVRTGYRAQRRRARLTTVAGVALLAAAVTVPTFIGLGAQSSADHPPISTTPVGPPTTAGTVQPPGTTRPPSTTSRTEPPTSTTKTAPPAATVRTLRVRAESGRPPRIMVNGGAARRSYTVRTGATLRLEAQFVVPSATDCWTFVRWEERSPTTPTRTLDANGPFLDYKVSALPGDQQTIVAVYAERPGDQCPL